MPKKHKLGAVPTAEVILHDPDHDAGDRVYELIAPTRSVKLELAEVQEKLEKLTDGDDAPKDWLDQLTRLLCDDLNLLLRGAEDAPAAGDLLFDGYMADRVTDDQIRQLHTGLAEAIADPT